MLKKYRYDFDQDDNLNKKCKFAQPIYSVDMFCSYCFLQNADGKNDTLCHGNMDDRPEWCPLIERIGNE